MSLIAFDYDETLISTIVRQHKCLLNSLTELGIEGSIEFEEFEVFRRREQLSILQLISRALPNLNSKVLQLISSHWTTNIENHDLQKFDKLAPGVYRKLEELKFDAFIIISARQHHRELETSCKRLLPFQPRNIFSVNPLTMEVSKAKAHVLAIQRPSIFVGDSLTDRDASKIANVPFMHRDTFF